MLNFTLDQHVTTKVTATLGRITKRDDIKSLLGPFQALPDYTTVYPDIVIQALCHLYEEYNQAFAELAKANREWETDYQFCLLNGLPVNWAIQIDMVGLPQSFLDAAVVMNPEEIREVLRMRIFEIENSLAMYHMLREIFSKDGHDSFFKTRFRMVLQGLRERFGKHVALLAITRQKFREMLKTEFGATTADALPNSEVRELADFDTFIGPHDLGLHLQKNMVKCQYLLYARTSDPIDTQRTPSVKVIHQLLGNSCMRQVIKENALTFNVDDPEWLIGDRRRINDTKGYMPLMRMAFPIATVEDLVPDRFGAYLHVQGIELGNAVSGTVPLRCKPLQGTYGCYGHIRGRMTDPRFRDEIKSSIDTRGPYIVQPEMKTPVIANTTDGKEYTYIDRNFFGIVAGGITFLGGVRNLIPLASDEARQGRIHGNASAVYAEIVSNV